jgi:2-polyprenyl-3-methyl-5-hydroxy-6-metoxy-1,4-benzoquinol methylase
MKITEKYRTLGVQEYYQDLNTQATYMNPHQEFVNQCLMDSFFQYCTESTSVLDLACGNGLISNILKSCGVQNIEGSDKYMHDRYTEETGFICHPYSFEDIADFNCIFENRYDVIICSYAFDLVSESYKQKLLYALSTYSDTLILIRPNSHLIDPTIWKDVHQCKYQKSRAVVYQKERHS